MKPGRAGLRARLCEWRAGTPAHLTSCFSLAGFAFVACLSTAALAADDDALAIRVLNRLAFGPNAESLAAIRQQGVDGWIAHQLHPDQIAEPAALTDRLDRLETQKLDPVALFEQYRPPPKQADEPDAAKAAQLRERTVMVQAADARLQRALYSPRQLQEVMVDFWFNHFNVYAGKGLDKLWAGNFENSAIRPYALGRFRNLLEATARHPAMLFYLDNWRNTAPGSAGAKGEENGLNENYARELMELHTLGVDGGYTQADVTTLARILTGWGLAKPRRERGLLFRQPPSEHGFVFDPSRHDFSDKVFLGYRIPGRGASEVETALDILAGSPATARHISFELAQYFVADQPPAALVDQLTRRWMETGGDIRAVLEVLFASPEFREPNDATAKFKTPFQYVVSATRAAEADVVNVRPLLGVMRRLGEPLYGCPTPDGYKNTRDAWLNPDALAIRIGFATALGSGTLHLDQAPPDGATDGADTLATMDARVDSRTPVDSDRLIALLGGTLSEQTREAAQEAAPALRAAVILGSPNFMVR